MYTFPSTPFHPHPTVLPTLCRKLETVPEQDRLEEDYHDYLQAPLQPLQVGTSRPPCSPSRCMCVWGISWPVSGETCLVLDLNTALHLHHA